MDADERLCRAHRLDQRADAHDDPAAIHAFNETLH